MAQDKLLPNGIPGYERTQVVDDQKKFTSVFPHLARAHRELNLWLSCRQDLTKQISKWGLGDAGFNYNLVAVFGSQSTGKSNLRSTPFSTEAWFADGMRWNRYITQPIIRYGLRRHE